MILGRDKKSKKSKSQSERVKIRGKSYKKASQRSSEPPTQIIRLSSKNEQAIEMQSINKDWHVNNLLVSIVDTMRSVSGPYLCSYLH